MVQRLYRKRIFEWDYKWFLGSFAWILHRITGLLLVFYLVLHIYVIHNLAKGPETFNSVMRFLASPLFKILEVGLWGVILYHSLNGIRVIFMDFWKGSLYHKTLFWILAVVFFILFLPGAYVILTHLG